jgi:hypothetical protein
LLYFINSQGKFLFVTANSFTLSSKFATVFEKKLKIRSFSPPMLKYRVGEGTAVEEFWLFINNLVDDANRKILFALVNANVSNRPNDCVDTVELLLFAPEIHELHSVACSQKCTLLWLRVYLRWSAAKFVLNLS